MVSSGLLGAGFRVAGMVEDPVSPGVLSSRPLSLLISVSRMLLVIFPSVSSLTLSVTLDFQCHIKGKILNFSYLNF